MKVAQAIILLLIAFMGTLVVLTRDTTKQVVLSGIFGVLLSVLFFLLHAMDVGLAAIVVGSVGLPIMILTALSRVRSRQ